MRELIAAAERALAQSRPVVYCRLVETRGSTPQKAGAAMLVFGDGSQAGTLGGGCVEAEVRRRALACLQGGAPEVLTFNLDSDYGWDDGLICGGRMRVLVEPLHTPEQRAYFDHLAQRLDAGAGFTEAIVFDAEKSGLPATACLLFDERGAQVASLRAESMTAADRAAVESRLTPLAERPKVAAQQGVAMLPRLERCRLVIVGGGHVGQAVAQWAPDLDFEVVVVDDRPEYVSPERFPRAAERLAGPVDQVLPGLAVTSNTYCLIVTRGHNHDEEALFHLVDRGARYVGMIGSKRKIRLIFDDLLAEGVAPERLARVFAPVGIDIGSQTVSEIAISILAELVAHRNRGGLVPGRFEPVLAGESS